MSLLDAAKELIVGLQAHNGKGICVMERLELFTAIAETQKRQIECNHRILEVDDDGNESYREAVSDFCPKCGKELEEQPPIHSCDGTRKARG